MTDIERRDPRPCPFLVPVMADRLWMRPTAAYCRRPGERVRIPAPSTLACICETAAHLLCPGYVARLDRRATEPERAVAW
jgi:hypothetical protein